MEKPPQSTEEPQEQKLSDFDRIPIAREKPEPLPEDTQEMLAKPEVVEKPPEPIEGANKVASVEEPTPPRAAVIETTRQEAIALAKEATEKNVLDPEKLRGAILGALDMGEFLGRLADLEREVGVQAVIETSAGDTTLGKINEKLQQMWNDDGFRNLVRALSPEGITLFLANNGITSAGGLREAVARVIVANRVQPETEKPSVRKRIRGWFGG